MEQYFNQLRSFKLMRKHESDEAAMKTFIDMLLDQAEPLQLRVPETLLYGYSAGPVLLYTGSQGVKAVLNATTQHVSDFLTLCSQGQNLAFRSPLCVARQETTTVIMDTLGVSSLWHKCIAAQKKLILQKFVLCPGDRQIVAQAKWKSGATTILTFANKNPHYDQNSYIKLYSNTSPEERFLTFPMNSSIASEGPNQSQVRDMVDMMVFSLRRHFKSGSFSEVEEFLMEFVQDVDLNWYAVRLVYYELDRKPRTISRSKLMRIAMSRSHPVSIRNSPQRRPTKRETFTAKSLTFAVSPFELKQAVKLFDTKRKRIRSSFLSGALKKSASSKTLNTSMTLTKIQMEDVDSVTGSKKTDDLLPIFQFPTPKTGPKGLRSASEDDSLGLLKCPMKDRIGLIRDHIIRQNNSLYMRIHYQVELPEKRMMKEICSSAVDKAVTEMERLRTKAKLARESLKLLKARTSEM